MLKLAKRRRLGLWSWVAVACATGATACAWGQEKVPTSLDIVPHNTSTYFATMHHSAVWNAVVESRAFDRLWQTSVGQKMRKAWRSRGRGFEQFGNNPFAHYLQGYAQVFDNPGAKMVMPFLREALENELFVYADDQLPAFMDTLRKFQLSLVSTDPEAMQESLARAIRENARDMKIPTFVAGCVLSDAAHFRDLMQLARSGIEQGVRAAPPGMENLAESFRVIEDKDSYLLTFTVKGADVPWEELDGDPSYQEIAAVLEESFSDKSLAIAVGVHEKFLIATIGPSLNHVENWKSGPKLIDMPRLAPLKKALDDGQTLTSVYYSSAEYNRRAASLDQLVTVISASFKAGLSQGGDDATKQLLLADVERESANLLADMQRLMPAPSETFGYSLLSSEGLEGFRYDFSQSPFVDSSKPLTLLQHAGRKPALVVAGRGRGSQDQMEFVKKWGGKFFTYAEKYVPMLAPGDEDADEFLDSLEIVEPFWERLISILQQKLLPATEGRQSGLVVDFAESHRQWHAAMPLSSRSLPVPSAAVVLEIVDRAMIESAGSDLLALFNDVLAWVRTLPNVEIPPEFELVPPAVEQAGNSAIYAYRIPPQAGLEESIVPHARLSDNWLVFAYFPTRSEAILEAQSFEPVLPLDTNKNAFLAVYFNANEWVDAINSWILYSVERGEAEGQSIELMHPVENEALNLNKIELLESWDRLIEFARCFRGATVFSYHKADATITQYKLRFVDIDN